MLRSFVVALVTVAAVVLFSARDYFVLAQQPPVRANSAVPIQISGAAPGSTIELLMNAGKVGNIAINSTGQGASVLDFSNMGKVQVQVYVDVCQDGKVVKVLVVSGQPPPEDNCKRRLAGAAWWSDCGVTRLTVDITQMFAHVDGCGGWSRNKLLAVVAGTVGTGGLIAIAGGGSSTTAGTTPVATTPPAVAPPPPVSNTPVTPPVVSPPPTTPTPQPAPSVPVEFAVAVVSKYFHPGGSTSIVCFDVQATAIGNAPPLNSTATYTGTISGPGVVSGGTFSGNLDASGRGVASAIINSFGNYIGSVTVLFGGTSRSGSAQIVVGSNQGNGC